MVSDMTRFTQTTDSAAFDHRARARRGAQGTTQECPDQCQQAIFHDQVGIFLTKFDLDLFLSEISRKKTKFS